MKGKVNFGPGGIPSGLRVHLYDITNTTMKTNNDVTLNISVSVNVPMIAVSRIIPVDYDSYSSFTIKDLDL